MSIGSAGLFDLGHLNQLRQWCERYGFCWHSEHLSYARISAKDGGEHNAGLALPVPYDEEVLRMIGRRVEIVRQTIPIPFLLENNVYYAEIPDQEMTEAEFLNRMCGVYGSELLLDLHNVYTNALNHRFEPLQFLEELDLKTVREVHIAGGNEIVGVYTDSHAGPCPDGVWTLLEYVCDRAPNLLGITFEFHVALGTGTQNGIQTQADIGCREKRSERTTAQLSRNLSGEHCVVKDVEYFPLELH